MKLSEIADAPAETEAPKPLKLSQIGAADKPAEGGPKIESLWNQLAGGIKAGGAGMKQGLTDVAQGVEQLAGKLTPPAMFPHARQTQQALQGEVKQDIQKGERAYQADPNVKAHALWAGLGRVGGNIAGTAPLMAIPGGQTTALGRAGAGAAAGALGGATAPVAGGDYWSEKVKQVGLGAAGGGALAGAGAAIGPPLSASAQQAINQFPHIAGLVRGTALRSPANFQRGAMNQALDPIKTTIPPNVKAGHDLINAGEDVLSDAYNRVLPRLNMQVDDKLTADLASIKTYTGQMGEDKHKQLQTFIENHFEAPVAANGGVLAGRTVKKIQGQFGSRAASYVRSMDADQKALGEALYETREAIMDAAARQNPGIAAELKNVNLAYAQYARVRAAAGRNADSKGEFTPHDLLVAARKADGSPAAGNFAKGDALMQAVGEATLGPMSVPKVNRILTEVLGGAIGAATHGPMGGVGGALAGAAGPEIARGLMRATQNPVARGLGAAATRASPLAGEEAAKLENRKRDYFEGRGYRIPEDDAR